MNHSNQKYVKLIQFQPIVVFVIVVLLGFLFQVHSNTAQAELREGDRSPDFTLPNAIGDAVSLSDYVGQQPVLLYFHMAVG